MTLVVALAGASGSGKSTLARGLTSVLGPHRTAVLPIDAYYHDLSHLEPAQREQVNFDHPDAIDLGLFAEHIETLKRGRGVDCPLYDFSTHSRLPRTEKVLPAEFLLVEGILVASNDVLVNFYDHLIFVEADSSLRRHRRLKRDKQERARDQESIGRFWVRAENTFAECGARAREKAQLIVCGEQQSEQIVTQIIKYIGLD